MKRRLLPLLAFLLLVPCRAGGGEHVAGPGPLPDRASSVTQESRTIRVSAVGDIMMGTTYPETILPPADGATMFRDVAPLLAGADIVFGNLEGALTEGGRSPKCGDYKPGPGVKPCFAFRTPHRYALRLKEAGFNALNVANNHSLDFGMEGIDNTLSALDNAGIQAVGGERMAVFHVAGKRIVVVGFSYSLLTRYVLSLHDIEKAGGIVADLKRRYDLVFVSFHGGAEGREALPVRNAEEEYLGEKRGNPVRFAHAVVDAGADLVLGHGPHVPRALEVYRGKLIAYSLGNFSVYSMFNLKGPSGWGYVLQATLSPDTGDLISFRTPSVELRNLGIPQIDREGKAETLLRNLSGEYLSGDPGGRQALFAAWK